MEDVVRVIDALDPGRPLVLVAVDGAYSLTGEFDLRFSRPFRRPKPIASARRSRPADRDDGRTAVDLPVPHRSCLCGVGADRVNTGPAIAPRNASTLTLSVPVT
jgi:hypothetical protein